MGRSKYDERKWKCEYEERNGVWYASRLRESERWNM
jgi:hypothetical protein